MTKTFALLAAALMLAVGMLPPAHAQKTSRRAVKPTAKLTTRYKPTARRTSPTAKKAAPSKEISSKVWVNTKTGVYHMPSQRWYGATKQGEYMTEKEAQSHGYTHTHNGQ